MDMQNLKPDQPLPEEIIEDEILVRLPVKSVLRFRSVSKAWCCLFGSDRFIQTHLQFSTKKKAKFSFISDSGNFRRSHVLHHISVGSLSEKYISVVDGLVSMSTSRPQKLLDILDINKLRVEMVGCCDGLVCIKLTRWRFILWNPSTRISKELPIGCTESEHYSIVNASGFGWDESSGSYKVCAYAHVYDTLRWQEVFKVYCSKTNSWKTVDNWRRVLNDYCLKTNSRETVDQESFQFDRKGKFVSGKVHWRGRGLLSRDIVWFDLKSEVFGVMELPTLAPGCDPEFVLLGEHEGCLCVVSIDYDNVETLLDMWVMKEESWFRMVAALPLALIPDCRITSVVASPDGHEIWLCSGSGYLPYDLNRRLALPFKPIKVPSSTDDSEGFVFGSTPQLCIQSLVRP